MANISLTVDALASPIQTLEEPSLIWGTNINYTWYTLGSHLFSYRSSNAEELHNQAMAKFNNYMSMFLVDSGVTNMRFPGGLCGNSYRWGRSFYDSNRPYYRIGPANQREDHGEAGIGTDDWLSNMYNGEQKLCEPLIIVNMNRYADDNAINACLNQYMQDRNLINYINCLKANVYGENCGVDENFTSEHAAAWVEYCNAEYGTNPRGGTNWANVRYNNGRESPYYVKYWELGNELLADSSQREMYKAALPIIAPKMRAASPNYPLVLLATTIMGSQSFHIETFDQLLTLRENYYNTHGIYLFDAWTLHQYIPGTAVEKSPFWFVPYKSSTVTFSFKTCFNRGSTANIATLSMAGIPGDWISPVYIDVYVQAESEGSERYLGRFEFGLLKYISKITVTPSQGGLRAGINTFRLVVNTQQSRKGFYMSYVFDKQIENLDTSPEHVDLRSDYEVAKYLLACPDLVYKTIEKLTTYTGGLPIYITEYATLYENHGSNPPVFSTKGSMMESVVVSSTLHKFMRFSSVKGANYWEMFAGGDNRAQVEGVGFDINTNSIGLPDPRKRPVYYVIKMYSDNSYPVVFDIDTSLVAGYTIDSDYKFNFPAMENKLQVYSNGSITTKYMEIIGTRDTVSNPHHLSLFVNNKYVEEPLNLMLTIQNFSGIISHNVYLLSGNFMWSTNERENCASGDCVVIRDVTSSSAREGNVISFTMPPCSIALVKVNR